MQDRILNLRTDTVQERTFMHIGGSVGFDGYAEAP